MAAGKKRSAKGAGGKKVGRGRLPSKRSINLILIDDKKINPIKAILGTVVVLALAGAFGKFMVADKLNAMSEAENKAAQAREALHTAEAKLEGYGDVEETYAHYTYAGMTDAEVNMVDRNLILDLTASILPGGDTALSPQEFIERVIALIREYLADDGLGMSQEEFGQALGQLIRRIIPSGYRVRSWNVDGTNLNIQITGTSLERLNRLARQLEQSPIVDSCAIITANKRERIQTDEAVQASLIVYLQNPVEEEAAQ